MARSKLRIGIIGCGTIGSEVAKACIDRFRRNVTVVAVSDRDNDRALALCRRLPRTVIIRDTLGCIRAADLIVEAASASALPEILRLVIRERKDILVMSVGGFLFQRGLIEKVRRAPIRTYCPSGAIAGLDAVKAAAMGTLRSVTLTTTKPPSSFRGAPYIEQKKIDLEKIDRDIVIFEGTPSQAVRAFPQNINVAAVLSLAADFPKIRIRIVASPAATTNTHAIRVEGDGGTLVTRVENVPSRRNPKTSQMAVFAAIATLKGIIERFRVGT